MHSRKYNLHLNVGFDASHEDTARRRMLQERHGVPTGLSSAPLDLPPRSVGPSLEETIASRAFKKAQEEAEAAAAHLGSCGVSLLPSDLIQRGKAASRRVSGAPTAFGALSRKARAGPRTRLVPLHGEGVGGLPHSASAALLPTSGSRPTSIPDDLHHSASAAHLGRPQAEGDVFSPSRTLGEGGVLGFGGGVKTECEGQTSTFMTSLPFGQGEVSTALLEESSASASYRGPVGGPESPSKRGAQSRDRGRDREGGGATLLPMKSVSSSNLPLQSIALSVSPSSSPSRSNRHGLPLPGRNFCRWMKYPRKRDNRDADLPWAEKEIGENSDDSGSQDLGEGRRRSLIAGGIAGDTKALEEATPGGSALVSLSAEMKRLSGGTGEAAYQRLKNRIGELHGRVGNLEKLMAYVEAGDIKLTPRSKQASGMCASITRTVEALTRFFDVDIDEDGSGFRVRSQAATIVQKRWRGFFARRKFLKLQSALERYRVRSFVHFGSAVMKWLEKRNHTDWVIKRWHQVCNEKAKKAVFKAWKVWARSQIASPEKYAMLLRLQDKIESRQKKRIVIAWRKMAKTMNVAWMPEHIPLRNEVLTSISRAALAAKPRAGMTQAEKEKAVRQKLLNMSAHLVRTKAHLRSLSVHFDSWRRLATSRALQQASLGLKELKEKAFFIWSLSVRKKRQIANFQRKWGLEKLRRIFRRFRNVARREFQLVSFCLDRWLAHSYAARSLPFKAWYVATVEGRARKERLEGVVRAKTRSRAYKLKKKVFESWSRRDWRMEDET